MTTAGTRKVEMELDGQYLELVKAFVYHGSTVTETARSESDRKNNKSIIETED